MTTPQPVPVPAPQPGTPGAYSAPDPRIAPPAAASGLPGVPPAAMSPAAARQPARRPSPFAQVMTTPSMKTMGTALGIGVGSAFVMALISAALLAATGTRLSSVLSAVPGLSDFDVLPDLGKSLGSKIFQIAVLLLASGVGGSWSGTASYSNVISASARMTVQFPFALSGVALIIGCAFGAYLLGRRLSIGFRWTGVADSAIVGVLTGLVYVLFGAIAPLHDGSLTFTAVTLRTFAMAFLTAFAGSLLGYALAQYAPDAGNAFTAFWNWSHRIRGFARTAVDAVIVYGLVFTVLGIIAVVVYSITSRQPVVLLLPLMLPGIPLMLLVLSSFGVMTLQQTVSSKTSTLTTSLFAQSDSWTLWALWGCFIVFLLTTLVVALRAAARNIHDPYFATWANSWKAPLLTGAFWLLATFLVIPIHMTGTVSTSTSALGKAASKLLGDDASSALSDIIGGSGTSTAAIVQPSMSFFLVAAAWSFLVEVIALTFGRTLVVSWTGLWGILRGGTVRPTPKGVVDYVYAGGAAFVHRTTRTPTPAPGGAPAQPVVSFSEVPAYSVAVAAAPSTGPLRTTVIPMSVGRRRGVLIGIIMALALAVCSIIIGALNSSVFSARTAATTYLAAISSGDYDQANIIAAPGVKTSRAKLLTNAAAKRGTTITAASVTSTAFNANGSRTVKVSFKVGGTTASRSLTLVPSGRRMLLFTTWRISTPMTDTFSVDVPDVVSSLKINGVTVTGKNARKSGTTMTFTAYPGVYRVTAADSAYITSNTVKARVGTGEDVQTLSVSGTQALKKKIVAGARKVIDTCAESDEAAPDGCPFSFDEDSWSWFGESEYQNFRWSVTDYPRIESVDVEDGTFSFDEGVVDLTYQDRYDDEDDWTNEESSSYVSGTGEFTISGDTVTVTLGDSSY